MLRKILKWTGGIIAVLITGVLIFYFIMHIMVKNSRDKIYNVEVRMFDIPSDSASIAAGAHIYATRGCGDCHGTDLGGKKFLDEGPIGRIYGTNLTRGKGGRPADYTDRDWLLALRHGIRKDGKPLLVMPSYEYYKMTDADLGSLIAYLKSATPRDNETAAPSLGPLGTVLSGIGQIPLIPAEKIDHAWQPGTPIAKGPTAEYGQYLSMSCTGCHKPNLKGGESPIPGGVFVRDITPSGNIGKWSEKEFIAVLRTGNTPDGRSLKNDDMPWQMTSKYSDEELTALYRYLKTL
ncbi:c-type cytochrome [Chitinophaga caseinilytica]|uniref:C-type cytochrome n=1 Tax=Chitinophaga caseinilytica TaxID=2267521 RepID=A0ABZ2Z8Z5_9BACT